MTAPHSFHTSINLYQLTGLNIPEDLNLEYHSYKTLTSLVPTDKLLPNSKATNCSVQQNTPQYHNLRQIISSPHSQTCSSQHSFNISHSHTYISQAKLSPEVSRLNFNKIFSFFLFLLLVLCTAFFLILSPKQCDDGHGFRVSLHTPPSFFPQYIVLETSSFVYMVYFRVYGIVSCIWYTFVYIVHFHVCGVLSCIWYTFMYMVYFRVYGILLCI